MLGIYINVRAYWGRKWYSAIDGFHSLPNFRLRGVFRNVSSLLACASCLPRSNASVRSCRGVAFGGNFDVKYISRLKVRDSVVHLRDRARRIAQRKRTGIPDNPATSVLTRSRLFHHNSLCGRYGAQRRLTGAVESWR